MAADEIHVGDTGTVITAIVYDGTSVIDISLATGKSLVFKLPDGTFSTQTAAFTTTGSDGSLSFTSTSGTFSQDGGWQLQAIVTFPASKFYSDIYSFRVWANLV